MCGVRYWIKTGSGEATLCESLRIGPRSIDFTNMAPDVLTLVQHRKSDGTWMGNFAHDRTVRFYREDPDSAELSQVFCGRVLAPETVSAGGGDKRIVRVAGVLQAFAEYKFVRGSWDGWLKAGSTRYTVYDSNFYNSPVVGLFYGNEWREMINGYYFKYVGQQTIPAAFQELIDYVVARVSADDLGEVWSPELVSNYFGPSPLTPKPAWEENVSCDEWLVKVLRPQVDAFVSVDYSGDRPALRAGRYRDEPVVELPERGWPLMETRTRRRYDQEAKGIAVAMSLGRSDAVTGFTSVSPITEQPSGKRFIDRRTVALISADTPSGVPSVYGPILADSLIRPLVEADITLHGDAWQWCRPGTVVKLAEGGDRMNVQTASWDLTTDTVTARTGAPRQLGIGDLESLSTWLWRNVRGISSASTPS